jgi:hypothetical protein
MSFSVKPPTAVLVADAGRAFDEENEMMEAALTELFRHFPQNTIASEVLLKVVALNQMYYTHILAFQEMALHIQGMGTSIDAALATGDPGIVDAIARITIRGKLYNFFSFASKYCSWHKPDLYPIYDSQVDRYLWVLQKQVHFSDSFTRNEFADYSQFRDVVADFRRSYGLESVSFKDIDKFLWKYGAANVAENSGDRMAFENSRSSWTPEEIAGDNSFHADMLSSEAGNAMADKVAADVARELGFSEEEISRNIGPHSRD